ncbi:MAG TPA: outer membrane lipoprotein-sorting protein [Blastocatellia bacterium]|nr:outer membrane lipoprotein-sorting protein [Blastocatellia bacterium]
MKRIGILSLAATFFLSAALFSSKVEANGQLDQVLANMQREAQKIRALSAKMEQIKRNTVIGGKEIHRGHIFFKHAGKGKDKVLIKYEVPAGQAVSVVGDEIILFQPNIKQAIITTRGSQASQNQEFAFFSTPYSLTSTQIKARYHAVYIGEEQVGGSKTSVLELTPKAKSAVSKIKWWVDQSNWLPIKSEVVEADGNLSTFTLTEIQVNGAISDGMFKISIPNDFKKIKR